MPHSRSNDTHQAVRYITYWYLFIYNRKSVPFGHFPPMASSPPRLPGTTNLIFPSLSLATGTPLDTMATSRRAPISWSTPCRILLACISRSGIAGSGGVCTCRLRTHHQIVFQVAATAHPLAGSVLRYFPRGSKPATIRALLTELLTKLHIPSPG